jgi:hypothetical protein
MSKLPGNPEIGRSDRPRSDRMPPLSALRYVDFSVFPEGEGATTCAIIRGGSLPADLRFLKGSGGLFEVGRRAQE